MGILDDNNLLMGLATGLLAEAGPSPQPRSLGRGFGQGLMNARQLQQQAAQQKMLALQAQALEGQLAREKEKRGAWQQLLSQSAPSVVGGYGGIPGQEGLTEQVRPGEPSPFGAFPASLRPILAGMDSEQGMALLARLGLSQAEAANKPPATQEFFGPNGRPYKAQWNPATKTWEPVGGSKTDVLSPERFRQDLEKAAAQKPVTNVTIEGEKAFYKAGGEASAKNMMEQQSAAQAALTGIQKTDDLISHLETSDAITGLGADYLKDWERAKVFVSGNLKAGKKVSDTELLDALMGSEVFPMVKALGIGARGLDTPAEREFLRQVMTGTTTMNKDTLTRMAELRRKYLTKTVEAWNSKVESGELDDFFKATMQRKQAIPLPERTRSIAPPPGFQLVQ